MTRILNSAQRMERLIGDLLDLTRARLGGTIPLRRRRTDLHQVCEEVLVELRTARPEACRIWSAMGSSTATAPR